jgi:hypothetical protein
LPLGGGFVGAGIVDEVFVVGGGGDGRGDGGVGEGAGQAVGDAVQPGDRVVGEQRLSASRQRQVMPQVGGRFGGSVGLITSRVAICWSRAANMPIRGCR